MDENREYHYPIGQMFGEELENLKRKKTWKDVLREKRELIEFVLRILVSVAAAAITVLVLTG